MMKIKNLIVENFRCFTSNEFDFTDETVVRAFNASGKSSLAEAVIWCMYGTNIMGKTKCDSLLLRDGAKHMRVATVWESATGETIAVERVKPEKVAVKIFVNGSKAKPGQIETLFFASVNEFLSVFIPGFFSSLDPKDAKLIIARYSDIAADDVLKPLQTKYREALANDKFGMGYDSIEVLRQKVVADIKELEDDQLRFEGEITSHETLLAEPLPEEPKSMVTAEHRSNAEKCRARLQELESQRRDLEVNRSQLQSKIEMKRETYRTKFGQKKVLKDTCPTCKQKLQGDALQTARTELEAYNNTLDAELNALEREGVEMTNQLEELLKVDSQATQEEVDRLTRYVQRVDAALTKEQEARNHYEAIQTQRSRAQKEIERLKGQRKIQLHTLETLKVKLEAIKAFRSQYVRLQQSKLDGLFDLVKIELCRANEDGEMRDVFNITWKGKPYQLLSHSEKVRCDIEIGNAISMWQPNPEPFPVFIDEAQGIQNLFTYAGDRQMIAAYVFNSQLIVEDRTATLENVEEELKQLRSLLQTTTPIGA